MLHFTKILQITASSIHYPTILLAYLAHMQFAPSLWVPRSRMTTVSPKQSSLIRKSIPNFVLSFRGKGHSTLPWDESFVPVIPSFWPRSIRATRSWSGNLAKSHFWSELVSSCQMRRRRFPRTVLGQWKTSFTRSCLYN